MCTDGAERFHDVLSVLRDFESGRGAGPRPLAVVRVEKFLFDAKDAEDLDYGTIRNAMEQTDGRLCLRYDDGYGHGYLALENDEFKRWMKPEGFDRYNGPFGTSVDLLEGWLQKGKITLTVREKTPFANHTQDTSDSVRNSDEVDR